MTRPDASLAGRFTTRSTWALIGALIALACRRAVLRRLQAGAVIARVPSAIRALQAAGFVPVYATPQGTYLVLSTIRAGDGVHPRIR